MQLKSVPLFIVSHFVPFRYLQRRFPRPLAHFIAAFFSIAFILSNNHSLAQALNGNYTIGGTNPNFLTINAAVQQLDSVGVSGPVTFWIRNGTYPEVLFIDSVNGASATNTITFRSESGDSSAVVINGTTTSTRNNTLWMSRVAYMRFHQLTFRQLPSVHNNAVVFVGRGHNLTFSNCVLWGTASSTSSGTEYVFQGACDSNLLIENCIIRGASTGIVSPGSSFPAQQRPTFRNNHLFGIITDCIYVVGGAFADISNNRIEAGSGSSTAGILLSGHSRARIVGNRISVLSGAQNSHGIQIISSSGWANQPILIANNEISFTAGSSPIAYGIRASGSYHLYAHNSVRMSGGVYSVALQLESTDNCRLFNNVLVHEGTATANHALHLSINSQDAVSNYNNLYTAGPNLTPIHTTLASYQAVTGRDSLSVSVPPQFTSTSVLIPNAPALMNSGLLLPEVPTDINGRLRNNPPDLGAYEQLTAPLVALGPDTSACDSFVLAVPTQPGTQWLWSTGDTLRSIVIRNSGTYWLQGTNSIGVSRDTVVVTILPRPSLLLGFTADTLCSGDCVTLQAQVSGGSGSFNYLWQPSTGLNNAQIANPIACPMASTTYRLLVTDANGCTVLSDSVRIRVTPPAQLSVGPSYTGCDGDTIMLEASTAWTGAQIRWEPALWIENPNQARTRAWPPPGTRTFVVLAIHPDGCRDTAQQLIRIGALPAVPMISYQNGMLQSSANSGNQWFLNDTLLAGANGPSLQPVLNGRYRVVVTDSVGCSRTSAEYVILNVSILSLESDLRIWPNPASDWVRMNVPEYAKRLLVYDVRGVLLQVVDFNNETVLELNTSTFLPGNYYFELQMQNGYKLRRNWVKQ
jgi:hypothetical protein